MTQVSVSLYTQHLTAAGQIRSAITAMKAVLDQASTRDALIALNSVQKQLLPIEYPLNLVGRNEALSQAIQNLEGTLSAIEDAIRGTLLYPVQ